MMPALTVNAAYAPPSISQAPRDPGCATCQGTARIPCKPSSRGFGVLLIALGFHRLWLWRFCSATIDQKYGKCTRENSEGHREKNPYSRDIPYRGVGRRHALDRGGGYHADARHRELCQWTDRRNRYLRVEPERRPRAVRPADRRQNHRSQSLDELHLRFLRWANREPDHIGDGRVRPL